MIFDLLGAIYLFKHNNIVMFICALTIWGFTLLGLIIESQNRYKSVIYWALAVLAGLGAYTLYSSIRYVYGLITKGVGVLRMWFYSTLKH